MFTDQIQIKLTIKISYMYRTIGKQFRKPNGLLGRLVNNLMEKGNLIQYNKLLPLLDIKQNDRILEIGYGHGIGVDKILSENDCFVSGIDFSKLMYKVATKRNKKHIENKKVDLRFGDFLTSEIIPNQYNKVFCINVVYFWDKLEVPFSMINTALKDGGIFCIFMRNIDYLNNAKVAKDGIFNKYSIDYVVKKLELAGFDDISYKFDLGYIIKCRKGRIE